MKLLRFGPAGQEKPGLLDDKGVIRDLTGHVGDITGDVLGDEALARIAAIDPATLPVSGVSASCCASGSTIPTMQPNPACRSRIIQSCS